MERIVAISISQYSFDHDYGKEPNL